MGSEIQKEERVGNSKIQENSHLKFLALSSKQKKSSDQRLKPNETNSFFFFSENYAKNVPLKIKLKRATFLL